MKFAPEVSPAQPPNVSEADQWSKSAGAALQPDVARELPDNMLMGLLATAVNRQTVDLLFEEIFDRYNERVGRWCYNVTKNRDRALDLAQEVFLKAFSGVHTFRGDAQLSTWLYMITRNHCLNSIKKRKMEPDEYAAVNPLNTICSRHDDPHLALERRQSYQQAFRFLSSILTPMEVKVVALHYMHDFTLPAITCRLGLSNPSGAKAFIVSARRKLKFLARDHRENRDRLDACFEEVIAEKRRAAA